MPETKDSLQNLLKPVHMRYAQYINKILGWKGHLWQGRFFSSALDSCLSALSNSGHKGGPIKGSVHFFT